MRTLEETMQQLRTDTVYDSGAPEVSILGSNIVQPAGWVILLHASYYLGILSNDLSLESCRNLHGCVALAVQYPGLKALKPYKTAKLIKQENKHA